MSKSSPTFIELFSGAGLFSLAFKNAGFLPKLAIEIDADAAATYEMNIGNHVLRGDVTDSMRSVKCDLIVAGPPCQGFSTLNRNRQPDPRNLLSLAIIKWIDVCEPNIIVVENVPPFLKSEPYQVLSRRLRRRGFRLTTGVLDASQFGAPQFRQRAILIASRIGHPELPQQASQQTTTVRDAWKGISRRKYGCGLHIGPEPSSIALRRMKQVPQGGDRRDIMKNAPELAPPSWWRLEENANTGVWGRIRLDEPAPTLRTCFQNPSKGRFIHPAENRTISLLEGARLQGFPDSWSFAGSRASIARQIGNAVPLPLGVAVATQCGSMLG